MTAEETSEERNYCSGELQPYLDLLVAHGCTSSLPVELRSVKNLRNISL